jgi:hypothetical protein
VFLRMAKFHLLNIRLHKYRARFQIELNIPNLSIFEALSRNLYYYELNKINNYLSSIFSNRAFIFYLKNLL